MTISTVLCIVIGCLAVICGIIALVNAFHTAEVDNCECDDEDINSQDIIPDPKKLPHPTGNKPGIQINQIYD